MAADPRVARVEYRERVARLEREAHAHPTRYKLRVFGLVVLGHVFVWLWIGLVLAIAIGVIWVQFASHRFFAVTLKLEFLLLAAAWVMLRALWVKLEPPDGRELTRAEAPQLFTLVDACAKRLRAPVPHRVLVDDRFNASIAQTPRWGVFGGWQNDLVLGLPLMQSLGRDEFRAVLAHEFGHLSGSHGRFGAWVYRVRLGWELIGHAFSENRGSATILRPFFRWYLPRLDAATFALARRQEYEADRAAADLTSPAAIGSALVRLEVLGRWLNERFWPDTLAMAREVKSPPARHALLPERLAAGVNPTDAQRWLSQSLAFRADPDDTHPSLTERLAALGVEPGAPPTGPASDPAERLLGDFAPKLRAEFDTGWQNMMAEPWTKHGEELRERVARLAELRARAEQAPLSEEEQWELIVGVRDIEGDAAAEPLATAYAAAHPDYPGARFVAGSILLSLERGEGLHHLKAAIELDPLAIVPACDAAAPWLRTRGRVAEAEWWDDRRAEREDVLARAAEERQKISKDMVLAPHDITREQLQPLAGTIADVELIADAWLVRREVEHAPEMPAYVLVIRVAPQLLGWTGQGRIEKAVNVAAQLPLPEGTFIVAANGVYAWLGGRVKTMEEARVK